MADIVFWRRIRSHVLRTTMRMANISCHLMCQTLTPWNFKPPLWDPLKPYHSISENTKRQTCSTPYRKSVTGAEFHLHSGITELASLFSAELNMKHSYHWTQPLGFCMHVPLHAVCMNIPLHAVCTLVPLSAVLTDYFALTIWWLLGLQTKAVQTFQLNALG